jgi:hypothetical protein
MPRKYILFQMDIMALLDFHMKSNSNRLILYPIRSKSRKIASNRLKRAYENLQYVTRIAPVWYRTKGKNKRGDDTVPPDDFFARSGTMCFDPRARTTATAPVGSPTLKLPISERLSLQPYSAPRRRPEPNPAARDCSDRPTPPASIAWSMLFRCCYAGNDAVAESTRCGGGA